MSWKSQVDDLDLVRDEAGSGVSRSFAGWIEHLVLDGNRAAGLVCCQSPR